MICFTATRLLLWIERKLAQGRWTSGRRPRLAAAGVPKPRNNPLHLLGAVAPRHRRHLGGGDDHTILGAELHVQSLGLDHDRLGADRSEAQMLGDAQYLLLQQRVLGQ
jgi:hypothetical protein